jgi:hypothetical protein
VLNTSVGDLALRVPSRLKVGAATEKWVVRRLARQLLPSDIVD